MSVGVKGLRIGTGPRGNYIHMGRGGLYYRASLGSSKRQSRTDQFAPMPDLSRSNSAQATEIETGNVMEMMPSTGSDLLQQINDKMNLWLVWPWLLVGGLVGTFMTGEQPGGEKLVPSFLFLTAVLTFTSWWWDKSRRAVVALYDISDEIAERFGRFTDAFDNVGLASRIWNIDTSERTNDWKRNAGASRLLARKPAQFIRLAPAVLKTNVSVPCIQGGKQSVHFLPDCVLIVEGKKIGAISYSQFEVLWNTTLFIETDGVPPDSQVVGHTWGFVNKNGGPDRRFNNNRQIPQVRYQQMGMRGTGGFQKILHISRADDRSKFDAALAEIAGQIRSLGNDTGSSSAKALISYDESSSGERRPRNYLLYGLVAISMMIAALLYFVTPATITAPEVPKPVQDAVAAPPNPVERASDKPTVAKPQDPLRDYAYRQAGNLGSFANDAEGTVTEFYRDLETTDGDAAAEFVIPEKRERGPLSAPMLTAKFSDLQEPLHLDNVKSIGETSVLARYSYMPASGLRCVGLARVAVEKRKDETLIRSVHSSEACR